MGYSPYRARRRTVPSLELREVVRCHETSSCPYRPGGEVILPPLPASSPSELRARPQAAVTAAVALPLLLAGCAPDSVTSQGDAVRFAYDFFLWTAAGVFSIVSGLIVWSIIRYRRRGDELPKQIHGSNKLELTWTLLPFILVLILFAVTLNAQGKVLDRADNPAVTIKVTGFQWSWQFDYEGSGAQVVGAPGAAPTMVVPVGQPVRIKLVSADVVHSFYVPRTLFKRQAIPGTVNEFDLTFDQPGTYNGHCVQFCGVAHADMGFDVRVVSQSEFQSWLQSAPRAPAGTSGTS